MASLIKLPPATGTEDRFVETRSGANRKDHIRRGDDEIIRILGQKRSRDHRSAADRDAHQRVGVTEVDVRSLPAEESLELLPPSSEPLPEVDRCPELAPLPPPHAQIATAKTANVAVHLQDRVRGIRTCKTSRERMMDKLWALRPQGIINVGQAINITYRVFRNVLRAPMRADSGARGECQGRRRYRGVTSPLIARRRRSAPSSSFVPAVVATSALRGISLVLRPSAARWCAGGPAAGRRCSAPGRSGRSSAEESSARAT